MFGSKINKYELINLNFQPHELVGRGSETTFLSGRKFTIINLAGLELTPKHTICCKNITSTWTQNEWRQTFRDNISKHILYL